MRLLHNMYYRTLMIELDLMTDDELMWIYEELNRGVGEGV